MIAEAVQRALVIVPTYNERDSIAEVARRLFETGDERIELLVIDDGSPDGTAEIVKQMAAALHPIHLIERSDKLGLGSAYITGFRWAIDHGFDAVVEMDADLSHDPADVPRLVDGLAGADLVIGSRYVPGGGTRNWSRARNLLSRGGNLYARALLGFDVRDSTAGFRAYRTSFLATQDLASVASEGYAFQVEMTRRVHRAGARIREVPITFTERTTGRSKMSRTIVFEALFSIPRWAWADRTRGRPR